MKFNHPDFSDHIFLSLTDPDEWAAANWRGTAFLYAPEPSPNQLPGIGLAFEDFEAGKKIFDGWLKRLGHTDPANELRVSIVEGPVPGDPEGYTVLISANLPDVDRIKFVRFSQMNRMNPAPGSPHLRMFKHHFAKVKRFRIFPAHFSHGNIKDIDFRRYVEKRELILRHTSELKPHELEAAALNSAL